MEISQTIKLTQMLQVFDQNKEEKKASFIIDDQGTVFKTYGKGTRIRSSSTRER